MYFTHAGDPDTVTMKKYGSGQGLEKSVARMPRTRGFCLWASE